MNAPLPIAVLVSGSGTNLQALLDACDKATFPAKVVRVISNVATAGALVRAQSAGVPTSVLEQSAYPDRESYDAALAQQLRESGARLVCLAGFMRLLSPVFLKAFPGAVMNVHPALLPSFPGLNAVRQAIEHGVPVSGCTVHLVDQGTDTGPIVIQAAVPVLPQDDETSLAARIQKQEHVIYPLAVRWFAERRLVVEGRRVRLLGATRGGASQRLVSPEEAEE
jgi:phosphoribosylglycinamide formyltransferase 1